MPRKAVPRQSGKRKAAPPDDLGDVAVEAFFRPAAASSLQSSGLNGEESRLQQMRLELGRVVSRRVELQAREEKLTRSIKRLTRTAAKSRERGLGPRMAPGEASHEKLFPRTNVVSVEVEYGDLDSVLRRRWSLASQEFPFVLEDLESSHERGPGSSSFDQSSIREVIDRLQAREVGEGSLEEGMEDMYSLLSTLAAQRNLPPLDPRLRLTLRRCFVDMSALNQLNEGSEAVRQLFLLLMQLSIKGIDDQSDDGCMMNRLQSEIAGHEKPDSNNLALKSDNESIRSPESTDVHVDRHTEIPVLNLDITIPDSPSTASRKRMNGQQPLHVTKQIIVDLTISPESGQTEYREGSNSQQRLSSTSSISAGLPQDETIPEGCFVYDPEIVMTYVVPGSKRKYYNDISTVAPEHFLQTIPEEKEVGGDVAIDNSEEVGGDLLADGDRNSQTLDNLQHIAKFVPFVPGKLTTKELDRMMQNSREPDFGAFNDCDLKLAANKYGLKNMRRSALVKVLRSIWKNQGNHNIRDDSQQDKSNPGKLKERNQKDLLGVDDVSSFIRECWNFYEKVLSFQPLDLDELHNAIALKGQHITKPKLRDILDDMNVFVTYGQTLKGDSSKRQRMRISNR